MENSPLSPAERVALLIKKLDVTTYQFGKATGISHQTLSNVLTSKNKPGLDTLQAIAAVYPAAAIFLLTGQGEPFPDGVRGAGQPATNPVLDFAPVEPEPLTEPRQEQGQSLYINRDGETETYWQGIAGERLKRIETLEQTVERLWSQNTDLIKKPEASADAADLYQTVDQLTSEFFPAAPVELPEFQRFRIGRLEPRRLEVAGFGRELA